LDENISLLIVDDYPVVLSGLETMLSSYPDIQVAGLAQNGAQAVQMAAALRPNVVMMNLRMPDMDGIEATRTIKQAAPEVNILIFSGINASDSVVPVLNAGAIGYLLKDASEKEIVQAVRQVAKGEASIHPAVLPHLVRHIQTPEVELSPLKRLTEREMLVLKYMVKGLSNQEIADQMVLSVSTVNSHVAHILAKLDVSSRTRAVIYAMRVGITAEEGDPALD